MTKLFIVIVLSRIVFLLALIFMVSIVSAAEPQADLNVTKVVSSTGPYAINDTCNVGCDRLE